MRPLRPDNQSRPIFSLSVLLLLAAGNIFLPLFIVPKFEQIYRDALGPDYPLPGITNFIIGARIPIVLISVVWAIVASIACWQRRRATILIINLGYLFFVALIVITIYALFKPMVSIDVGMSDASLSSPESSR